MVRFGSANRDMVHIRKEGTHKHVPYVPPNPNIKPKYKPGDIITIRPTYYWDAHGYSMYNLKSLSPLRFEVYHDARPNEQYIYVSNVEHITVKVTSRDNKEMLRPFTPGEMTISVLPEDIIEDIDAHKDHFIGAMILRKARGEVRDIAARDKCGQDQFFIARHLRRGARRHERREGRREDAL